MAGSGRRGWGAAALLLAVAWMTAACSPVVHAQGAAPANAAPQEVATTAPVVSDLPTVFHVKYVAEATVYLDGGHAAGLAEGMKLAIKRPPPAAVAGAPAASAGPQAVAQLVVVSVAETSAVCDLQPANAEIHAGDVAYLSQADTEALAEQHAVGRARAYPIVVTFSEGDTLEEEARDEVPRPPLPEVNRARGRIGFDYSSLHSTGTAAGSSSYFGVVLRADITRIGGTYWNLSGYWRGKLEEHSSTVQPTLQDLINRTYHLSLTYDNPGSHWVAGFGRLYLPWASSLDTIDGGYFGRRLAKTVTAGVFAGSTPDPTSWNYNPNRRIAGTFLSFEGGSFDNVHYISTMGVAVSTLGWKIDRPFVFFENTISYKRYFTVYHALQADEPRGTPQVLAPGAGISRSYLTIRFQPHPRLAFDFNHNYFRDIPTFDPNLIGTGLVDKLLFQGFSVGVRVEPVRHYFFYVNLGRSNRSGDAKPSLNQLYGFTVDHIWRTGLRADLRYSKFDSSFARGTYRAVSLSRTLGEDLRVEVQAGDQSLISPFTNVTSSRFLMGSVDANLGTHYFLQGGFTAQRGVQLAYNQWYITLGYRFDNRSHLK